MDQVPPEKQPPPLPREVAGFRIEREIGRGGMGIVYEAAELASGRIVALKVLAQDLQYSDEAYQRFQRESRLAAAITHQNAVFVFGAHEIEGAPAIAMEFCTGETLGDRLRRGEPIPIETAVRWTLEVIDGLEAAHRAGVVHRDVKPSNCFLTQDGHVKVGDFGLSRTLEPDASLTQSGSFLGSPLYASPEQVRGREVDARSDLYSVGATLYALLTGRAPFEGGGVGEVLARILSEEPDAPRTHRPEIPRGLEKVVVRAMRKDPKDRPQSMAALRTALLPFADNETVPARRGRRLVAWIVDSLLVGVVSAAMINTEFEFTQIDAERPYMFESLGFNVLVNLLVPVLYHGLLEGSFGASLGKWLFGLRVVSTATDETSGRAWLRALVFFGYAVVTQTFLYTAGASDTVDQIVATLVPLAWPLAMLTSMRSRNGWLGLHELASGTRTLQRRSPFERFRPDRPPEEAPLTSGVVPRAVGPYLVEGVIGATGHGRILLATDPELQRTVWVHERVLHAQPADERRRALVRATRLRWFAGFEQGGTRYDVTEAPGGLSLAQHATAPVPWSLARRWLTALADELATWRDETGAEPSVALQQLWIDRSWNLRVLDEPIVEGSIRSGSPLELLEAVARLLLSGARERVRLPDDLPFHAEPAARRLLGLEPRFDDLDSARAAFTDWQSKPTVIGRNLRAAQIALSTALPVFTAIVTGFSIWVATTTFARMTSGMVYLDKLARYEAQEEPPETTTPARVTVLELPQAGAEPDAARAGTAAASTPEVWDEDRLRAHHIIVADAFGGPWGPALVAELDPRMSTVYERALELQPDPTDEELTWAQEYLDVPKQHRSPSREDLPQLIARVAATALLANALAWGIAATCLGLVLGWGLSFRMAGVRLRSMNGSRAGRLRFVLRSLVTWAPLALTYWTAHELVKSGQVLLGAVLIVAATLLFVAGAIYTVLGAGRSPQDVIAGTRLVPR